MTGAAAWLLCDPSPSLRYRVLTELLDVPAGDPEASDLSQRRARAPEVLALCAAEPAGLRERAWALCRFAQLGLDRAHPRVEELAGRVLDAQDEDGSWPLRAFTRDERYTTIPLQASLPLRGLAATGYATDPRVERGFDWLLAQQLDDGAWPTGEAAGQPGYVAGYRSLPGSRGCRANTQAALACLTLHPRRRWDGAARRALDLFLQHETREEWTLGWEVARLLGVEPATGFLTFHARLDPAAVLDIAARAGASPEDGRVADLVAHLDALRGGEGLWQHPAHPELTRWLTFDLLLALRRLQAGDWVGSAPRLRPQPAPH